MSNAHLSSQPTGENNVGILAIARPVEIPQLWQQFTVNHVSRSYVRNVPHSPRTRKNALQ